MQNGFVIEGAAELEAKLQTLALKLQKRVVKGAVRAGQKPMQMRARSNARALPRSTRRDGAMARLLAKHIVIKTPRKQRRGSYSLHVQMRSGVAAFTSGKSYIPAAIEYGHGSSPKAAARPFMRPAATATQRETMRIVSREMANGILREAIKGRYT